jgi:hypothetical protein
MKRWLALAALLGLLSQSASADILFNKRGLQRLYFTGTLVSCACASTSVAEVLQTYTVPAGTLANVGDTIHVVAAGTAANTTDVKTISVKLNASLVSSMNAAAVGANRFYFEIWLTKTGSSTQSFAAIGTTTAAPAGVNSVTTVVSDSAPITVTVNALNTTAATAGSLSLQYMAVDFLSGS